MTGPSTAPFVDVPGGRLWAQAAGIGTGVVLIHAGIADARMWNPQWETLAACHHVVRYDCRGYGRSESADVAYSERADLVAVMDAFGQERAVLVGASMGAQIAFDAALESPARVAGLVSVGGALGGYEAPETPALSELADRYEALEAAHDWRALADLCVEIWVDGVGQPSGRVPEPVRRLVRRMCLDTFRQEKPLGDTLPLDPPAVARLADIRVPVLVIVGDLDTPGTRGAAAAMVDGIGNARRIDLPGVAHLPSLERPAWFSDTLLGFLDEVFVAGL